LTLQTAYVIWFEEMSQRLYVGGLFHGITEDDIIERFNKFGSIGNVSIKMKQDGNGKYFFHHVQ